MSSFWHAAFLLANGALRKTSVWRRSAALTSLRNPLAFGEGEARRIARELERVSERARDPISAPADRDSDMLADRIRKETEAWNRNNLTRTQAYWNVYRDFPELHWALLAHMVSRNGGWSMTDLKGEWLPRLMEPDTAALHFELLETCNALIFRDAYPQLKLYAESRRRGSPLFRLLPRLGVSAFMEPFWERFWADRNPVPLTIALIVNEQNVIQAPVVEHPRFREHLLSTPIFRAQPWLQTTQIVFPLMRAKRKAGRPLPLAGRVLENFSRLEERIGFGKGLYAMLFGYPRVLAGVAAFAEQTPHTGSRADYWPERFRTSNNNGGSLPGGKHSADVRWFSPPLEKAWPDRPLPEAPGKDWFRDSIALDWLSMPKPPLIVDMTYEHLYGQRKLEAASSLALPKL